MTIAALGLTGSVGMGKSTAARMLERLRIPVFDADAAVHRAMAPGGAAVPALLARFPDCRAADHAIDRRKLSDLIARQPDRLAELEAILHPLVRRAEQAARRAAARRRARLIVLDIPLLFETGGERRCRQVMVVTAPGFLQRQRVLARPGMNVAKLEVILAKQLPDTAKRRLADHVIRTGLGMAPARAQLLRILHRFAHTAPRHRSGADMPLFAADRPDRWRPAMRRFLPRHLNPAAR